MKAAMNSHVAQERHTMFQSSAENVQNRLGVMLKELEVDMNDKADEVYIAMRRDYNSVLGGGEVPQNGEILPKTQRLVRREMIRIIDGVEKMFKEIAGLDVKDEDDGEEDKNHAHSSGDEDGGRFVGKEEENEDTKVKTETSPSPSQIGDQEDSPNVPMANTESSNLDSNSESEPKLKSAEAEERLDGLVHAKVDSDDSDGSESSDGFKSD